MPRRIYLQQGGPQVTVPPGYSALTLNSTNELALSDSQSKGFNYQRSANGKTLISSFQVVDFADPIDSVSYVLYPYSHFGVFKHASKTFHLLLMFTKQEVHDFYNTNKKSMPFWGLYEQTENALTFTGAFNIESGLRLDMSSYVKGWRAVTSFNITTPGTGYQTSTKVSTKGGSGDGALLLDITADENGAVTSASLSTEPGSGGTGYLVGDVVKISGLPSTAEITITGVNGFYHFEDFTHNVSYSGGQLAFTELGLFDVGSENNFLKYNLVVSDSGAISLPEKKEKGDQVVIYRNLASEDTNTLDSIFTEQGYTLNSFAPQQVFLDNVVNDPTKWYYLRTNDETGLQEWGIYNLLNNNTTTISGDLENLWTNLTSIDWIVGEKQPTFELVPYGSDQLLLAYHAAVSSTISDSYLIRVNTDLGNLFHSFGTNKFNGSGLRGGRGSQVEITDDYIYFFTNLFGSNDNVAVAEVVQDQLVEKGVTTTGYTGLMIIDRYNVTDGTIETSAKICQPGTSYKFVSYADGVIFTTPDGSVILNNNSVSSNWPDSQIKLYDSLTVYSSEIVSGGGSYDGSNFYNAGVLPTAEGAFLIVTKQGDL